MNILTRGRHLSSKHSYKRRDVKLHFFILKIVEAVISSERTVPYVALEVGAVFHIKIQLGKH